MSVAKVANFAKKYVNKTNGGFMAVISDLISVKELLKLRTVLEKQKRNKTLLLFGKIPEKLKNES